MTIPDFFLLQEPFVRNGRIEGLRRQWTSWLSADNLEEMINELEEALSKLQDENVIVGADMNEHCVRWGYRCGALLAIVSVMMRTTCSVVIHATVMV
ncbi:hypothetical protein AVEN_200072-1 [Araneus ventricosus]|uniref:Endonuclease/exonuclease/phosphatase domain-containing protein n=1 Tax=Araneus ventricosus TaxID=182803 RepID=A0A4Y2RNU4_ARAVE|nr:hypothetical protein AVEN_200072-1 [Araneus ventricosus]